MTVVHPGPRHGPADSASEELHPLQPATSREEAEGHPQFGSGNHRKGIPRNASYSPRNPQLVHITMQGKSVYPLF